MSIEWSQQAWRTHSGQNVLLEERRINSIDPNRDSFRVISIVIMALFLIGLQLPKPVLMGIFAYIL